MCGIRKGEDSMTYKEAVRQFRKLNHDLYEEEVDYWTAQEAWAVFTDSLFKDGEITQRQWITWQTPFKYGKPLKIKEVFSR